MAKKQNDSSTLIHMGQLFFGIAVFLIFAFILIGEIVLPSERDVTKMEFQEYAGEWNCILDDGKRIPASFPGKVPAKKGDAVRFVTILPDDIHFGEKICFRAIWQDVNVYIDGELRKCYNTVNSRPFGINSTFRYVFVDLQKSDSGKELTYEITSYSKYAGQTFACYRGNEAGIWGHLAKESGTRMAIAFFLILLSMFCIILCSVLKVGYGKKLELNHFAWAIFLCAGWMLSEIGFRQVIFKNLSVISNFTYWSLMLIPIPLIMYTNTIQKRRYEKFFECLIVYVVALFVLSTILQIFDIRQFVDMLPFIHGGLFVTILSVIITILIDTVKKRSSDYAFIGIGICGLLITGIIELFLYYQGMVMSLGTILALGLVFLLIMAIIKTGQDFFYSEKKRQQAIAAREAQAMFLANMSHEIRTPINAVIGMNEMILRESRDEEVKRYAQNIQSASNMLLGLINDVLDFSKIESGQLELVEESYSLAQLIRDEMVLLNARAEGKAIETELEFDKKIPDKLYGDEIRIKQIITNLLSNAVKYTKEGKISLKVFFRWLNEDKIELCFAIKDTGIGIKEEDLEQLYHSFKRLEVTRNRNIEGTGLGLNIAKQLVELMQGNITVESEYGKGSTFTVYIPQKIVDKRSVDSLELCRSKKKILPERFIAPRAKVLVVDDNSMNLSLMKELLKRTQIQVELAQSGKECLRLTRAKKYHIILMDHMMPEMDGVETLRRLREDEKNPNQNTIVIALTANATVGCREKYLEYGFYDYFSKPIQAVKLDELLIQYLPKELIEEEKRIECKDNVIEEKGHRSQEEMDEFLVIEQDIGIAYCMNSEQLYKKILQSFCKQAWGYLPQLETHFQNRDWEAYAIIVHGLKGNALNIGASNFSKLSLQHEKAAKSKDETFLCEANKDYVAILRRLLEEIEKILE